MNFILNSAVITSPGTYSYKHITADAAKKWLETCVWVSTVGYVETAKALEQIAGIPIPVDRRTITMEQGDEALVFRLNLPPGNRRTEPISKGGLGVDYILDHCEIGILERID
jgi:hypothetical protein